MAKCKSCGALLNGNKCEYCGNVYETHDELQELRGQMEVTKIQIAQQIQTAELIKKLGVVICCTSCVFLLVH